MASQRGDLPADALPQGESAKADSAEAWVTELERRAVEVGSGAATTEDWASVKARLADRWRRR